jgi:hypothetical protein
MRMRGEWKCKQGRTTLKSSSASRNVDLIPGAREEDLIRIQSMENTHASQGCGESDMAWEGVRPPSRTGPSHMSGQREGSSVSIEISPNPGKFGPSERGTPL